MTNTGMGERLTSWEELLDNHASVADNLRTEFISRLDSRDIPHVTHDDGSISVSLGETRQYHFSSHKTGAYLTSAIRAYGKDLFISWVLWWKPKWNMKLILAILAIGAVFGIVASSGVSRFGGSSAAIYAFFATFVPTVITLFVIVCLAGLFMRGNILGFLQTQLDFFTEEDMSALTFAVDHSLRLAADAVGIKVKLRERSEFFSGKKKAGRLF